MKITLKNIAKVKEAEIEINGITVIAGENNTGKSTVGKALFAVFNSFYNLKEEIKSVRSNFIESVIEDEFDDKNDNIPLDLESIAEHILNDPQTYLDKQDTDSLKEIILDAVQEREPDLFDDIDDIEEAFIDAEMLISIIDRINENLSVSDIEVSSRILEKNIAIEFKNQINNIFFENSTGEIWLKIQDDEIHISVQEEKITDFKGRPDLSTQLLYLDDPFILDEIFVPPTRFFQSRFYSNAKNHRALLRNCLVINKKRNSVEEAIEESRVAKRISSVIEKINSICGQEMQIVSEFSTRLTNTEKKKSLQVENLSTGVKSFYILKRLLEKGYIEDKGTIVLDEPEVHLHPEWQLVFAEVIVLLQKEFNLHILINTHSPYFLRAIQVYAGKHEIADKCNYYLAKNEDSVSIIKDVSDDIEKIYQKLAYPLQKLEDERWKDD